MPPTTALGRILLAQHFACPTNWWASVSQSVNQSLRRPFWGIAVSMTPPGTLVLSQSLQLFRGVSSFFDICLQIAAPCVSQ